MGLLELVEWVWQTGPRAEMCGLTRPEHCWLKAGEQGLVRLLAPLALAARVDRLLRELETSRLTAAREEMATITTPVPGAAAEARQARAGPEEREERLVRRRGPVGLLEQAAGRLVGLAAITLLWLGAFRVVVAAAAEIRLTALRGLRAG